MTEVIEVCQVYTLNGELINKGEWDYKPYQVEVVGNPFPGPMEAPEDWDFQITFEEHIANPLPDGAILEEKEVFFDRAGALRLLEQASELETESRILEAKTELNALMIDVQLGLASPEQVERAIELRNLIKSLETQ